MHATDAHGQPVTAGEEAARHWRAFERRFNRRESGDTDALRAALAADPGFAVGHAMAAALAAQMGYEWDPAAELAAARETSPDHAWERSFVAAAGRVVDEGRWEAVPAWLSHHDEFPANVTALAFVSVGLAMSTDPTAGRRLEERVRRSLAAVGDDDLLLGLLGMVLVDRGEIDEAHRLAARALELAPAGYPGGHPMAHVFFESGEHAAGAAWLDGWLPSTDGEAAFHHHLVWHSALHHLELGDAGAVLERYRTCATGPAPSPLLDGASLLWRCQLRGLVPSATDPARPAVATQARPLMDEVPFTFAGAHGVLALASSGDAEALYRFAANARGFTAPGAAELLPGLAEGCAAYVEGDHAVAARRLLAAEPGFARLGGSHAQREVFEDTLLEALVRCGRLEEASDRLRARLDRRPSTLDEASLASLG